MRFSVGLTLVLLVFGSVMISSTYIFAPWSVGLWATWIIATVLAVIANHVILFKYVTDPPSPRR